MKRFLSLVIALAMVLSLATFAPALADDEKVPLTVVVNSNRASFFEGEDENNNYIINYLEEKSGVDLNWIILPSENGSAKLNAMMASANDVPDVIANGDRDNFMNYYADEMIIELDEYIGDVDEYFKNDMVGAYKYGILDGHYYAICTPGNQSDTTYMYWYNKQALLDADIEQPAYEITLDEYTDILYKLQETYPDKIVMGSTGGLNKFSQIYAAFGIANPYRVTADNTIEYAYASDDMKECLQYLNKLYTDGIIDKEFLVTDKEGLNAKMMNGDVIGAQFAWYDYTGTYEGNIGNKVGASGDHAWDYIQIIDGGKATKGQTNGKVNQFYMEVSYACEHPQEAVNLINIFLQPEYYDLCFFGTEGVDYYYDENGTRWRNPETQIGKGFADPGTQWYVYYYFSETKDQRINRLATGYPDYDLPYVMYSFYGCKQVDNPLGSMPVIEAYQDSNADITDVMDSYFIKFVMGDISFDQWDAYLAELDAVGLQKVLTELNDWYATL